MTYIHTKKEIKSEYESEQRCVFPYLSISKLEIQLILEAGAMITALCVHFQKDTLESLGS